MTTPSVTISIPNTFDTPSAAASTEDWGPERTINVECTSQAIAWIIQTAPTDEGPWSYLWSGLGDWRRDFSDLTFKRVRVIRTDSGNGDNPSSVGTLVIQAQPVATGPQGPEGPQGPAGPAGPSGAPGNGFLETGSVVLSFGSGGASTGGTALSRYILQHVNVVGGAGELGYNAGPGTLTITSTNGVDNNRVDWYRMS